MELAPLREMDLKKSEKHLPALDGLRGLAVLTVVAYHVGGGARSSNAVVRSIGLILKAGWGGVTLFFILSGFLITGILWDTCGTAGWMKSFYVRRTFRIFPLYYATLLFIFLFGVAAHRSLGQLSHIWVFLLYLQNTPPFGALIAGYGQPLLVSHLWSLATEEQFYLLWPLLLVRMKSPQNVKYLCLAVVALSFVFRLIAWTMFTTALWEGSLFARAGELAAGGYLAMCYRDESWATLNRLALPAAVVSMFAFAELGWRQGSFQFTGRLIVVYGLLCLTLFSASILVLSLRQGGLWNRAMNVHWLRWIGGISYGIYIFHVLLSHAYAWIAARILPNASRNATLILTAIVTVILSFSMAWLSFRFFEQPMIRRRPQLPVLERPDFV